MTVCVSLGPVGDSRLHQQPTAPPQLDIWCWAGAVCYQHILSHAASVLLCVLDGWCDWIWLPPSLVHSLPLPICVFEYAYYKQICEQLSVALDDSVSR